ncbi:MAG: cytidyltransferase [Bdellovibrionales bacterium]|nr:cytidyltransferase [Bdellovibrionales bacterium]
MKVIAILPVKGSSSRIKHKNLQLLDGQPLFLHTLKKLIKCRFIDEVYLDTESDLIINLASDIDCKIFKRDPLLSSNNTDGNKLLLNEVKNIPADIYIQILSTSPFIEESTIEKGVQAVKSNNFDSAVLMRKEKLYTWNKNNPNYSLDKIPNSIDLEDTMIETMGLYIISQKAALKTKRRIGEKPFFLEASAIEAVDVNWPDDFSLANLIAIGKRETERKLLNNIKTHLTSSMLSDILDDLKINSTLEGYTLNLPNTKIFGKVKTLKLRLLKNGEDFKGIYKSLESYNSIIPNDIIVVKNDAEQFAYFGELNANLAIRSGASAAIISSPTRDSQEVKKIGFPVFSKGYTCKDVRGRATLESYNKDIEIDNIKIATDDLIFGDSDGITVIPNKVIDIVLKKAFEVIQTEKNILIDIAHGINTESLIKQHGFF